MGAEMTDHLGYAPGDPKPTDQANRRNGNTGKTVLTDDGPVRIEVWKAAMNQFAVMYGDRFTGVTA
jgi:transposase-like protein